MKRRSFLKKLLLTTVTTVVAPKVVVAKDLPKLESKEQPLLNNTLDYPPYDGESPSPSASCGVSWYRRDNARRNNSMG